MWRTFREASPLLPLNMSKSMAITSGLFLDWLRSNSFPGADGYHVEAEEKFFSTTTFQTWFPKLLKLPEARVLQKSPLNKNFSYCLYHSSLCSKSIQRIQWEINFFLSISRPLPPLNSSLLFISNNIKKWQVQKRYWKKKGGLLPTPGNWHPL